MPGYHLVILGPVEPSPDLVDVINSPLFEGRLFYIIGSALNVQDLANARVDTAAAIMFLSNSELDNVGTVLDDAATVLKTMSVMNFNPDLDTLVQVLRSSDRDLLKDSDASIVLCMDDYKTALQARNAMCHGLATFVENLFQSFGSGRDAMEKPTDLWLSEYKYGLQMELYYIQLDKDLLAKLNFSWRLLVEAIYLEYGCMLLGVCRAWDKSVCLNPGRAEYEKEKGKSSARFFNSYLTGILLAPDDDSANAIAFAMTDATLCECLFDHLRSAEREFQVRIKEPVQNYIAQDKAVTASLGSRLRRVSMSLNRGHIVHGTQEKSLGEMKEVQYRLDEECFADISKRKSMKKRRSNFSRSRDSYSSDGEAEDYFAGYIESDSDCGDEKVENKRCGEQRTVESSAPGINDSLKNLSKFKMLATKVVHNNGGVVKPDLWSTVLKEITLHGEEEVADDMSSLNLLKSRRLLRQNSSQTLRIKNASHNSLFKGLSHAARAQTVTPTKSVIGAAEQKLLDASANESRSEIRQEAKSPTVGVAGLNACDESEVKTDKPLKKLSVNLRMEGFKKKKSSSFSMTGEEYVIPLNSTKIAEMDFAVPFSAGEKCKEQEENSSAINKNSMVDLKSNAIETDELVGHPSRMSTDSDGGDLKTGAEFGRSSRQIATAKKLRNHIIVMGCMDNIYVFINELRKPHKCDLSYHPILIVDEHLHSGTWDYIKNRYEDVYFIRARARASGKKELQAINIKSAFSLVLLASRERTTVDEATNIDSSAIFTYLKLHTYVPRHVFFTVELFLASSMGMLNSVIMRYLKNSEESESAEVKGRSKYSTGIAVSTVRQRKSTIKVSGSYETTTLFKEMSIKSMYANNLYSDQNLPLSAIDASSRALSQQDGVDTPSRRPAMTHSNFSVLSQEETIKNSKYSGEIESEERLRTTERKDRHNQASLFWDTDSTHLVLPVSAASVAYVPTGFDSIFCNVSDFDCILFIRIGSMKSF